MWQVLGKASDLIWKVNTTNHDGIMGNEIVRTTLSSVAFYSTSVISPMKKVQDNY